jgi:hypothetical protein
MNVEIGTEATQFPEKELINEIFIAVCFASFVISQTYKITLGFQNNYWLG